MAQMEGRNRVSQAQNMAALGFDQSVMTYDSHGRYMDAVLRGNVFTVTDQAPVTAPAGLSTSPINVTLFNPKGNNKNAVIIYAGVTFIVAGPAGAGVWIAVNTNIAAVATTGTAATPFNCLLGNQNRSSISVFTTATLPAAPVAVSLLAAQLTGAITTVPGMGAFGRFFDGALILGPGASLSFQFSTVSGTSGVFGEWIWEEVPIGA